MTGHDGAEQGGQHERNLQFVISIWKNTNFSRFLTKNQKN